MYMLECNAIMLACTFFFFSDSKCENHNFAVMMIMMMMMSDKKNSVSKYYDELHIAHTNDYRLMKRDRNGHMHTVLEIKFLTTTLSDFG